MGEFRARRAERLLRAEVGYASLVNHAGLVNDDFGLRRRFCAGLPAFASGIAPRLHRKRPEFRRRPERLRREHCLGKVEAEELIGTVLVRDRHTAPSQEQGASDGEENILQDHSRPREIHGISATTPHLRSRPSQFQLMLPARLPSVGMTARNFLRFVPEKGTSQPHTALNVRRRMFPRALQNLDPRQSTAVRIGYPNSNNSCAPRPSRRLIGRRLRLARPYRQAKPAGRRLTLDVTLE